MAALRPIERDPLEGPWLSLEDRYRVVQRERPRRIEGMPSQSNGLGNNPILTGRRTRGTATGRSLRGGTFAPRAVSGML